MEKNKKQISKIQKTQKQNKRGKKKRENQKGKMRKQWTCPFAFFFAFILLSRFAFFLLAFILLFAWKKKTCKRKAKKSKSKKQNNAKKNAHGQVHCFPIFSLFDVPFFPHLFCFRFFSVLKFCFLMFHVFSIFCIFFSSLKIIRKSYGGEHKFFLCLQPRNDPVFPFPPHQRKLWRLALPVPARLHQGYRVATCGWGKRRLQCQTCHAKFKGAVDLQPNYSTFHKENMMKYDDSLGTARHLR